MASVPAAFRAFIDAMVKGTGLPESVVVAQVNAESGFQAGVTSPAGAEGWLQFEPGTYAAYGGTGSEYVPANEVKPYINLMNALLKWAGGDVRKALAAYNAGQGNWQAGLGYADAILAAAGQPSTLTSGGGPGVVGQIGDVVGDVVGGTVGNLLSLPSQVTGFLKALEKPVQALVWIVDPGHWVRIVAGVFGFLLLITGLAVMSKAV
jgi:Transglycosylase SLT domain